MPSTTVTRRTRNLGYALATRCEQGPHGLRVVQINRPSFTGTPKQVEAESANCHRIFASGGTSYREAIFVGGKRVTKVAGLDATLSSLLMMLECGAVEVETE